MERGMLVFLLCCFAVCTVNAWGEEGHKIVAQIATDLLNSNANSVVQEYEGESGESLPDMAPLPDAYDHTSEGRWSAPMHYCNLPRDATSFLMQYCGHFCVVEAIQNYTNILSKTSNPQPCNFDQSDGVEPCALEFLVHFVGDVHQPLHVGYGDDEGGNTVKVKFFGDECNLHQVWDEKIIQRWNSDYTSATQQLESIMTTNASQVQAYVSDMNPIDWANESFGFVLSTVYDFSDFVHLDGARLPNLGDDYYNRNLPIVQDRLIAAGARLGQLLNNLFQSDIGKVTKILQKYINRVPASHTRTKSTVEHGRNPQKRVKLDRIK